MWVVGRRLGRRFRVVEPLQRASGEVPLTVARHVADFVAGALEEADQEGALLAVIRLDTPGGLDTSMRDIVKAQLGSRVPVVVFVSPEGSRAASAGAFITLAAHVAAMAPGTNIGSASPVQMGGAEMDSTMAGKVMNDAAATGAETLVTACPKCQIHFRCSECGDKSQTTGLALTDFVNVIASALKG